jgi:hypothetical protein
MEFSISTRVSLLTVAIVMVCGFPAMASPTYELTNPDPIWVSIGDGLMTQSAPTDSLLAGSADLVQASGLYLNANPDLPAGDDDILHSQRADLRLCILIVLLTGAVILYFTSARFRQYVEDLYSPLNWS